MTIPEDIAGWLQRHLTILCEEDLSIGHFASGNIDSVPDGTLSRWQLSVDVIYRALTCDLVAIHEYIECYDESSFFEAIRSRSPYDGAGAVVWNGTLIYGTKKLEALARSFFSVFSQGWDDVNPAFIEALEAIFAENGVPWSDKPLLPIMPSFRSTLIEARQPPLKDQYDEWLARIICYAFSVPVSPFVSQVNRATSETLRQQATQEGLVPLKAWVKNALDHVIQECMNEPGLEFVWVGDDAIDPLEQAPTLNILVAAGIKTREEAGADLGLGPAGGKGPAPALTDPCASADAPPRANAKPSVSAV